MTEQAPDLTDEELQTWAAFNYRVDSAAEEVAIAASRELIQLRAWKANAETTLEMDRRYIAASDARVRELEAWQRGVLAQFARLDFDRYHRLMEGQGHPTDLADALDAVLDERDRLRGTVARVNTALAQHPRCDTHPDGDVISCGWKRAVADVQAAIDRAGTVHGDDVAAVYEWLIENGKLTREELEAATHVTVCRVNDEETR
ncbi:hypothetical protein [Nocardia farcinica]|uniref:hypothetical protein n=1 Tax=Nocardia farcinica TaxID=37329 RepID=UPI0024555936|nr:hypothetical protein [Nocardia farcinica]